MATPATILVYVDDVSYKPIDGTPTEAAQREIPADAIAVIEYVDAATATIRWGTGHTVGAIVITTHAGG